MPDLLLPLPSEPAQTSSASLVLVDLVASTRLAHELPLTHYLALMSEFVQVIVLSFEARGGQVLQHQGDAVLGYWGEGAQDAACHAALESHDRAARLGLAAMLGIDLVLRAGVACGQVLTGMVGGQRSAYGLPVNYARRLSDAARPGQTLACASVVAALCGPLDCRPRPPLALRGFGPTCETYELAWPAQTHMKVD